MYSGLNRKVMAEALILTVSIALLCAALFCGLFYLLPFKNSILTVFANVSLGLSVFCGAFFIAARSPFFLLKRTLFLPFSVVLLLFAGTVAFGTFDGGVFLQKTILVVIATIFGEVCGRR